MNSFAGMFLNCIGSVAWWVKAAQEQVWQINTLHTFQKQCGLSQYKLPGPNGTILHSIPLERSSKSGMYRDVLISRESNWQAEQWKSITSCYLKSPFFKYYDYKIEPVFKSRYSHLYEFNLNMLELVLDMLKIHPQIILEHEQKVSYTELDIKVPPYPQVFDDRYGFRPDVSILDLLFNLGPEASDYLTGTNLQ